MRANRNITTTFRLPMSHVVELEKLAEDRNYRHGKRINVSAAAREVVRIGLENQTENGGR